ncbi:Lrp/AsnC family transcriptional regulator [Crenobacter sp. SG2305]|uniref:Lrp/AsnC family transcriptional regulator n=1 Tax=Crenobacter oryzisoli TaxID=3056844 RepID=UPI0025AACB57|nr:Lrp/AsnC family transcriptional regulator [Crenobacter sp. SG2305]MDN0083871.1 Lrp/AsnC family transcriptional regulator [Crenobacter sp. SG2305]
MDKYDRKIIACLGENARISYAELARRVNLSAPAVAERIDKLERAGVITGYRVGVDPAKIGRPIVCLIELTVKHLEFYATVAQLRAMPEVVECYAITGTGGLLIKVAMESMAELQALIARLMEFGDTRTSIVIDTPVPPRLPSLPSDEVGED